MSITLNYTFEKVNGNSPYFNIVKKEFENVIAPIYGDQGVALKKIAKATERVCEVLLSDNNVSGILVYKSAPNNEFANYGAKNTLELKTLFVVNAAEQSGKGIGTKLIERIMQVAQNEIFESVTVTVSDKKTESLAFFQKKGFKHVESFADKYNKGETELLHIYLK